MPFGAGHVHSTAQNVQCRKYAKIRIFAACSDCNLNFILHNTN